MKKILGMGLILGFVILLLGCVSTPSPAGEYVCPNGSVVASVEQCVVPTQTQLKECSKPAPQDQCNNSNLVTYYCDVGSWKSQEANCQYGCGDKECITSSDYQLIAQHNQKINDSIDALNIANQKINEFEVAFNASRYNDSRSRLSESKQQLLTASNDLSEACIIADQIETNKPTCNSALAVNITNCLIPSIDYLSSITNLTEDLQNKCNSSGCPQSVKSSCLDIISQAAALDAKCDHNYSADAKQLCNQVIVIQSTQ